MLIGQKRLMGFVGDQDGGAQDSPLSPCFHFRQLWSQKWKKADAAQTIKLGAEPLIVAGKGIICNHGHRGKRRRAERERDGHWMDRREWAGFGSARDVGGSVASPPEGRAEVWIFYLEQTNELH